MMTPKKERKPRYVVVHVAFSPKEVEKIDAQAEIENRTRINMIQTFVLRGLDTSEAGR
jgi:hypothetical protein